jgi:hypothetical protein
MGETTKPYKILAEKPEGQRALGRILKQMFHTKSVTVRTGYIGLSRGCSEPP